CCAGRARHARTRSPGICAACTCRHSWLSRGSPEEASRSGTRRPSTRLGRCPSIVVVLAAAAMTATSLIIVIVPVAFAALLLGSLPLLHPFLLHEVARLAAPGMGGAILRPVLLIHDRHVEVDRCLVHRHGRGSHYHGLRIDHRRRSNVADVHATVDP